MSNHKSERFTKSERQAIISARKGVKRYTTENPTLTNPVKVLTLAKRGISQG